MPLAQSELQRASQRQSLLKRQPYSGRYRTAFLSLSQEDSALAEGIQVLLAEQGVELYIDRKDATMPEKRRRETAERVWLRIKTCDCSSP